jgi:hypothetical protein
MYDGDHAYNLEAVLASAGKSKRVLTAQQLHRHPELFGPEEVAEIAKAYGIDLRSRR